LKTKFDLSARKFIDWMDSIERILDDKQANALQTNERQEVVQVDFSQTSCFFVSQRFRFLGNQSEIYFV